jgi:hypothetical protein
MARLHRGPGGEDRWNALWGRGGRVAITAAFAIVALALPVGAHAEDDQPASDTKVAAERVQAADEKPTETVRVIIEGRPGSNDALDAFNAAEAAAAQATTQAKNARANATKEAGDVAGRRPDHGLEGGDGAVASESRTPG